MSQYPPPHPTGMYAPPAVADLAYYTPPAELLAPARRAAVLQGVLGGFMLMCGAFVGSMPWVTDVGALIAQSGMTVPQLPPGVTLEEFVRTAYTIIGVVAALIGIGLLVLSAFVRHGGRGPAITSILLETVVLLVLAMNLVGTIVQIGGNPLAGGFALLLIGVPMALFGLNVAWLAAAARNAGQIGAARQYYQMQYHQYYQQQQAYAVAGAGAGGMYPGAQGYGYAMPGAAPVPWTPAPAAPQPPPAPPPSQSTSNAPPADPPGH